MKTYDRLRSHEVELGQQETKCGATENSYFSNCLIRFWGEKESYIVYSHDPTLRSSLEAQT